MTSPETVLQGDDTTDGGDLYLSFELGDRRWTLTLSDGRRRPSRHTVAAGDTAAVAECVRKAKARCGLEPTTAVVAGDNYLDRSCAPRLTLATTGHRGTADTTPRHAHGAAICEVDVRRTAVPAD